MLRISKVYIGVTYNGPNNLNNQNNYFKTIYFYIKVWYKVNGSFIKFISFFSSAHTEEAYDYES